MWNGLAYYDATSLI